MVRGIKGAKTFRVKLNEGQTIYKAPCGDSLFAISLETKMVGENEVYYFYVNYMNRQIFKFPICPCLA